MSSNLFPEPSITANTVEGLVKLCGITSGRRLGAGYFWSVQTITAVSHSQQLENWVLVTLLVLRKLSHNHTVCRSLSLVPRPSPFFCSLVCIQYNTRKWKTAKNGKGLVSSITWVTSGGRKVDAKIRGPTAKTRHWIIRSSALPHFWT